MKIRNKKTGEIITIKSEGELALLELIKNSLPNGLNVWEEVKEPLIKDEKIRKAVRAFSEAIQEKKHILVIKECGRGRAEFSNGANYWIRLPLDVETMDALEDRTYYTIAELCGEEEE